MLFFFQVTDLFRAESILIMGIVEVAKHNHFFFYCINNDRDSRCAFACRQRHHCRAFTPSTRIGVWTVRPPQKCRLQKQ